MRAIIGQCSLLRGGGKFYCCAAKPTDPFPRQFHRNIPRPPLQLRSALRVSCLRKPQSLYRKIKYRTVTFSVSQTMGDLPFGGSTLPWLERGTNLVGLFFSTATLKKIPLSWKEFAYHLHLARSELLCEGPRPPASLSYTAFLA